MVHHRSLLAPSPDHLSASSWPLPVVGPDPHAEERVRAAFLTQADWCDRIGAPFTALLCRLLGERIDR
ncbi:MAG: hypothetical protein QOH81_3026, partial [Sphingomonadales bacterium]|nr:hypothetical protein [Sphingomonadales bacterium]